MQIEIELYKMAKEADEKFHAECVRQFGENAGDYRYHADRHDAKTAYARGFYHAMMDAVRAAKIPA